MRQFKLTNGRGQTIDLMDKAAFFHTPAGLGFQRSVSTVRAGGSFLTAKDDPVQLSVTGEMVFLGYAAYDAFRQAVTCPPLTLHYKPADTWYSADCILTRLDKGELGQNRRLVCPIDFLRLTPWSSTAVVAEQAQVETGKVYPYPYPYTYAGAAAGARVLSNTSGQDAALCLTIFGPAVSPSWSITQNGTVLATGRAVLALPAGQKLVVNSSDTAMEMAVYTNDNVFVRDAYPQSDFSTDRFVYAPPGDSILAFDHEGTGALVTRVEVTEYADTV